MEIQAMNSVKDYLTKESNVILAFWYGSGAKGVQTDESDIDLAVYLKDENQEDQIWRQLTNILEDNVDLVSLNRAPATLISAVFKTGVPLVIKDRGLYWKLYLEKTMEAEDFADFAESYRRIYERSRSLTPEDKTRLSERITFLQGEIAELDRFVNLTIPEYENNKTLRREVERWTENIINALIDVSKIILAAEKYEMPKTYEEALRKFAAVAGLDEKEAEKISSFARLRNILAHEYLDILYQKIAIFLKELPPLYSKIHSFLEKQGF